MGKRLMFEYAVRKGAEFVAAFTYPTSITQVDKAWEASPGIRYAQCVKAILGATPYLWRHRDSAAHVAGLIGGMLVTFSDGKEVRGRRR